MFLAGDVDERMLERDDVGDGIAVFEIVAETGLVKIRVRVEATAARQRFRHTAMQRLGIAHGEQVVGFVVIVVDFERRQVVGVDRLVARSRLDLVVVAGNGHVLRADFILIAGDRHVLRVDLVVADGGHRRERIEIGVGLGGVGIVGGRVACRLLASFVRLVFRRAEGFFFGHGLLR